MWFWRHYLLWPTSPGKAKKLVFLLQPKLSPRFYWALVYREAELWHQNLARTFHNWKGPPDIWFCTNGGELTIKLTRMRSYWHHEVDCLHPRHCNGQESWVPLTLIMKHLLPFVLASPFFFPSCHSKDKAIICISGALAKGDLPDYYICHQSNNYYDTGNPVVLPVTNFSLISNASVSLDQMIPTPNPDSASQFLCFQLTIRNQNNTVCNLQTRSLVINHLTSLHSLFQHSPPWEYFLW